MCACMRTCMRCRLYLLVHCQWIIVYCHCHYCVVSLLFFLTCTVLAKMIVFIFCLRSMCTSAVGSEIRNPGFNDYKVDVGKNHVDDKTTTGG